MRTIAIPFVFVLNAVAFSLFAQEPPPPPAPLIWQPPGNESILTYRNSRFGFLVDFPGEPTVSEVQKNGQFNLLNFYSVRRQGSLTSIRVIDFTADDLKKIASKEFDVIGQVKTAYSQGSYKIEKIYRETADSVEFSSTDGLYLRRVSARLLNGKLFELYIDVTNWHVLSKHHPDLVEKFNSEAERFFNSFKLEK